MLLQLLLHALLEGLSYNLCLIVSFKKRNVECRMHDPSIMVGEHFLGYFLYRQLSRSRIHVSTVTFSSGETMTKRDCEKRSKSMDGDVGHNARTTQFLR